MNHADNGPVTPPHKNAPASRLFENQTQTAELFLLVRPEIAFLSEKFAQHFGQFVQVRLRGRLDHDFLAHRLHRLFQKLQALAIRRSTIPLAGKIDKALLTPTVTALESRRNRFSAL